MTLHFSPNTPSADNLYANDLPAQPSFEAKRARQNAAELRWKAAQWRKMAAESGSDEFLELMQRAASELEVEANSLAA
jgi:hypothetical protein